MKVALIAFFAWLSNVSFDDYKLDDSKVLQKAISDSVNKNNLKYKYIHKEELLYLLNTTTPYSGWAKLTYRNGQIKALAHYKKGKSDGPVIEWHEGGGKKGQGQFSDGIKQGVWTSWHKDGKKEAEGEYKAGQKDGIWITWSENRKKMEKVAYQVGIAKFRLEKEFIYNSNGEIESERIDFDGKIINKSFTYFPNGLKESEWTETGYEESSTYWYDNGQKMVEENYNFGELHGLQTVWYKNGQRALLQTFENGFLTSSIVSKTNGEKCPISNFKEGNGVVVFYYEGGTKSRMNTYKDGKLGGLQKCWYESGQQSEESLFKEDKKISQITFKPNGELCPKTKLVDGNGFVVCYNRDLHEVREVLDSSKGSKVGEWVLTPPPADGNTSDDDTSSTHTHILHNISNDEVVTPEDVAAGVTTWVLLDANDPKYSTYKHPAYYNTSGAQTIDIYKNGEIVDFINDYCGDYNLLQRIHHGKQNRFIYLGGEDVLDLINDFIGYDPDVKPKENKIHEIKSTGEKQNLKSKDTSLVQKIGKSEDGKLSYKGYLKDGKPEGLWTTFFPNGQPRWQGGKSNGLSNGPYTMWYENGNKKMSGTYESGNKVGMQTIWYSNGKKWREQLYSNGKPSGKGKEWNEKGELLNELKGLIIKESADGSRIEANYKDGKLHGKMTFFGNDGREKSVLIYENGKLIN
jgi:antitoxin component YwqK of YwqJK toxin-antitoxin module